MLAAIPRSGLELRLRVPEGEMPQWPTQSSTCTGPAMDP
jgi:hypothetical protein